MRSGFLLYGANGFVGSITARQAVKQGLRPVLGGRDAARIKALTAELGLEYTVFGLDDPSAMDAALGRVAAVLSCAGPFVHTFEPMVEACLRTGTHYLDLTGEIAVFEALAARDAEARARGVMLLPGAGFDVVATDCLAVHLKQRLPSATHLALAFINDGPARVPRGTAITAVEVLPLGGKVRRNGQLETVPLAWKKRTIDFGNGPVEATTLAWGDVFTAYYSTGIPNIEVYAAAPKSLAVLISAARRLQPVFGLSPVQRLLKRLIRARGPGPTEDERARTRCTVWGEVADEQGRTASSRLHGPEAGTTWTVLAALATTRKAVAGHAPPGFHTPAQAYGAELVLECDGVRREDLA